MSTDNRSAFPAQCTRELDVEPTGAPAEDVCLGDVDPSTGQCRTCGTSYARLAERAGYEQAITILRGVAHRTGSPAAKWAAEYLDADPDKEGPKRSEGWGDYPLSETYPGSGIYE